MFKADEIYDEAIFSEWDLHRSFEVVADRLINYHCSYDNGFESKFVAASPRAMKSALDSYLDEVVQAVAEKRAGSNPSTYAFLAVANSNERAENMTKPKAIDG